MIDTSTIRIPTLQWEHTYRSTVVLIDLIVLAVALRVGLLMTDGSLSGHLPGFIAAVTGGIMIASMAVLRVWQPRVLGQGAEEFRRLVKAVVTAAVVLSLTALAFDVGYFRPWVFAVLPVTGVSLLVSRYALRSVLHVKRARDRCMHPILVAGSVPEVADFIDRTRRERHYGWVVAGVCVPGGAMGRPAEIRGVSVLGGLSDVPSLVRGGDYRVVAVAPDAHWTRQQLRQLAWDLEGLPTELVVAPALMEVTGSRLYMSPGYGMPLLHVSQATFTGGRWVLKAALDRVAALVTLLLLAPVLLAIAAVIKLEDGGPVLFRQQRVGKAGEQFWMLKFRSMVVNAEQLRAQLTTANEGAGPLFKMRRDPRVTRVGVFLRRYSLDELPQLINVLRGDMSLVGPRPPLPAEVEKYGFDARRRLLVRPGLTGLWQVSGRSDLTWEETVRLDLRYVENWSLSMDVAIMWKTAGAVLGGRGAY
jgi:exopolysaccharide biosynthesis polyprenyl glycosylphosphotransferase